LFFSGVFVGAGGLGAEIGGDFVLTTGEILQIAVGGKGSDTIFGGGGGGGSFVVGPGNPSLIVAGGGGGGGGGPVTVMAAASALTMRIFLVLAAVAAPLTRA
jgi:hypothetical protein